MGKKARGSVDAFAFGEIFTPPGRRFVVAQRGVFRRVGISLRRPPVYPVAAQLFILDMVLPDSHVIRFDACGHYPHAAQDEPVKVVVRGAWYYRSNGVYSAEQPVLTRNFQAPLFSQRPKNSVVSLQLPDDLQEAPVFFIPMPGRLFLPRRKGGKNNFAATLRPKMTMVCHCYAPPQDALPW